MKVDLSSFFMDTIQPFSFSIEEEPICIHEHIKVIANIQVDATISYTGRLTLYQLEGTLKTVVEGQCTRCLTNHKQQIDIPILATLTTTNLFVDEFNYSSKKASFETYNIEIENEDTPDYQIENRLLDLDPIIRDSIDMVTSMQFLCKETCKGQCVHCGQNLNKKQCTCKTVQFGESSPFEILKKLL